MICSWLLFQIRTKDRQWTAVLASESEILAYSRSNVGSATASPVSFLGFVENTEFILRFFREFLMSLRVREIKTST